MQNKFKRIGGSFSHAYSSTLWKKSKNIEYADDSELSISIDSFSKATYAWINESKSIIPDQYNFAKTNYLYLKNNYKKFFTHDYELINLDSGFFKYTPANGYWIENPKIHKKSKLLSFITSNKLMSPAHKYRLEWSERLKGKCDIFGRGIKEIEKKEEGLEDYYFSIAIENGKYDAYFTEKILDCFATGTIPIYYGTEKIKDYFDEEGIIFLTDEFDVKSLTPDLYYSKKSAIENNFNKVLNYYTVEDWMFENYFKHYE